MTSEHAGPFYSGTDVGGPDVVPFCPEKDSLFPEPWWLSSLAHYIISSVSSFELEVEGSIRVLPSFFAISTV